MTEKRFNIVDLLETLAIADGDDCKYYQNGNDDFMSLCNLLNALHEENQKLQKVIVENENLIQLTYDDNNRLRNKNERLHKDFDKLYELCREHLTDEEIIKELDR